MCARLRYASRGLFVGSPKLPRLLARCLRFGGFDNTSSIFENTVASRRFGTTFSVLFSAFVPQRVALAPSVRNEVLVHVVLRDQVHVPLVQVIPGLQARESNRNEHVEQESQLPGLVKDLFADTLKKSLHALILRIWDSACLNFWAVQRVLEVHRLTLVSRWSSARP